MDTSVSVTAVLFTKDTYCKELLESEPKITRVVAGRIIVLARRNAPVSSSGTENWEVPGNGSDVLRLYGVFPRQNLRKHLTFNPNRNCSRKIETDIFSHVG
jgi:hypothetical protein